MDRNASFFRLACYVHRHSLVIINNSNLADIAILPAEADSKLVIDSDAPEPASVATEFFQPIAWWFCQIGEGRGEVQRLQAPQRDSGEIAPSATVTGQEEFSRFLVGEGLNHL